MNFVYIAAPLEAALDTIDNVIALKPVALTLMRQKRAWGVIGLDESENEPLDSCFDAFS